jgi:hypothetical protein
LRLDWINGVDGFAFGGRCAVVVVWFYSASNGRCKYLQ